MKLEIYLVVKTFVAPHLRVQLAKKAPKPNVSLSKGSVINLQCQ